MRINQVYATLFEFKERWEPTPYVAQSWTPSADGLTWTIKIKGGITFHDGTELTAEDVAFTINAMMDPSYWGPRKASVTAIRRVTAPDRSTVVVELHQPFAPVLQHINYGTLPQRLLQGLTPAEHAGPQGGRTAQAGCRADRLSVSAERLGLHHHQHHTPAPERPAGAAGAYPGPGQAGGDRRGGQHAWQRAGLFVWVVAQPDSLNPGGRRPALL